MPVRRSTYKLIVLGDRGVGKTSLVGRFAKDTFNERPAVTVAPYLYNKTVQLLEKQVSLQIWDTAGEEMFRSLSVSYCRKADCCVLVFDLTYRKSFEHLNEWMEDFLYHTAPDSPEKFPFLVIGNKVDLDGRQVSTNEALRWCQSRYGIPYYEASAKNNFQVDLAFQTLARNAMVYNTEVRSELLSSGSVGIIKVHNNELMEVFDETPAREENKCCP